MSELSGRAHFQLFASDARATVRWRLLSGNNRELGRAYAAHPDAESCLLAVKDFVEVVDELTVQVRRREGDGWGWALLADGRCVVTCGHSYDRQVRCEQAVANFCDLAATAALSSGVVVTASRRWVHPSQGRHPIELNSGADRRRRLTVPRNETRAQ